MDMERLRNSVNEANRKQESINKATTQQNDIQVFDFATKLFEEQEEAKKKFIDSIKNISDETLQELIERAVIENQDNDDFLISFFIDTPMFDLFYTQKIDKIFNIIYPIVKSDSIFYHINFKIISFY